MGLIEGTYRRLLELQNFPQELPGAKSYLDLLVEQLAERQIKPVFYEDLMEHVYQKAQKKEPYELWNIYGENTALFYALNDRRKQL